MKALEFKSPVKSVKSVKSPLSTEMETDFDSDFEDAWDPDSEQMVKVKRRKTSVVNEIFSIEYSD